MDDIFFFIQARSTSTRLPGKVLLNFIDNSTILDLLYRRLKSIFFQEKIIFLIPETDVPLKEFCLSRNYKFFSGSEEDVRQRFLDAAGHFGAKKIIRFTGDNPFIDREHLELLLEGIFFGNFSCISIRDLPLGMGAEAFTLEALEWEPEDGLLPRHREHVSLHIKENPNLFSVIKLKPLLSSQEIEIAKKIRVTIDEEPDLILCKRLYSEFKENPQFGVFELLELYKKNPDIFLINRAVSQIKFPIEESSRIKRKSITILYGGRNFGSGHRERMKVLFIYLQLLGYDVIFTEVLTEIPDSDLYILDFRDEKIPDILANKKVLLIDNMGEDRSRAEGFDSLPHPSLPFLETSENVLHPLLLERFRELQSTKEKQIVLYTGSLERDRILLLEEFLMNQFPDYSLIQIGEFDSGGRSLHKDRLTKFEFFSYLKKSEIFVSYFGLGIFEAQSLGLKIMIYSISDYHQELSDHFCLHTGAVNLGPINKLQHLYPKTDTILWNHPKGFENLVKKIISLFILLLITSFIPLRSEESGDILEPKSNTEVAKIKIDILKLTQEGQLLLRQGKSKDIPSIAQKIKSISESSPESYYLSGSVKYINNDLRPAISDLETGLRFNPNHDPTIFLLGLVYVRLNKYDMALSYFEKACKEAPYNPFYRLNLAILSYFNGNYAKAKTEAELAVKLKENYTKAKLILAFSLYRTAKKNESLSLTRELYDKKVEFEEVQLLYLKLLLEEAKNYDEVIQILAKKNKLNIEEKRILAYAFMEEGQYLKAIQFFRMVIDSGFDSEEDNIGYLKSLIMLGKSEDAEKLFLELNKKNFKDKKIYIETYYSTQEKKIFLKQLYQPFPV